MKVKIGLTVIMLAATSFNSLAEQSTQYLTPINGGTQIVVDTNLEQKDPLRTVLTVELPRSVKNIGQGMNFILQNSGYQLEPLKVTDLNTLNLYSLDFPLSHRKFYKSSVIQIIEALAGKGYQVSVNHLTRTIKIAPRV